MNIISSVNNFIKSSFFYYEQTAASDCSTFVYELHAVSALAYTQTLHAHGTGDWRTVIIRNAL